MKYVLIGVVFLWILYDVGSGVLMGLSKARNEQLAAMPMEELLETVARGQNDQAGSEWVRYTVLTAATVSGDTLIQEVKLIRKTSEELEAKWSRGWDRRAQDSVVRKTCRDNRLKMLLNRGALVVYKFSDKNGEFVLEVKVTEFDCG